MKVSKASTLTCPFMSNAQYNISCITDSCMAWKVTKTYETVYRDERGMPVEYEQKLIKSGFKSINALEHKWVKELPYEEREGYCVRIENKEIE